MDKKFENFQKNVNIVVKKRNKSKLYNISNVSKMLGLPHNESYNHQCDQIINFLKSKKNSNKTIKILLDNIGDNRDSMCNILVNSLYELFNPESLPKRAPIKITKDEYINLLEKKKQNRISYKENELLDEALNCKYCFCVKKLYLKNLFKQFIKDEEPKYNAYAVCMNSVYRNRDITPPFKVSHSCREKYEWYK